MHESAQTSLAWFESAELHNRADSPHPVVVVQNDNNQTNGVAQAPAGARLLDEQGVPTG